MDLVVPGATDEEVAKFAREQGFVGVGVYPSSGFVHVDVRTRSYFWIDRSGPGKKNRVRGILGDLASKSDGRATARGDRPPPPIALGTDVDLFLRSHTTAPDPASPHEDDDEDDDDESGPGDP